MPPVAHLVLLESFGVPLTWFHIYCLKLQCRSDWILYNFLKGNLTKSKLKKTWLHSCYFFDLIIILNLIICILRKLFVFCFFFFWVGLFVCHIEMSQTTMPPVAHLVLLESFGVPLTWFHIYCLKLQCRSDWIVYNFLKGNLTKSKLKKTWLHSWYFFGKPLMSEIS